MTCDYNNNNTNVGVSQFPTPPHQAFEESRDVSLRTTQKLKHYMSSIKRFTGFLCRVECRCEGGGCCGCSDCRF